MSVDHLRTLVEARQAGRPAGITSVCSAHPLVIEAALREGLDQQSDVLIEATCNQVNQDGGYTGLTPAAFRDVVFGIAGRVGFPPDRIILGGDHLGPNPWKALPAEAAMAKAEAMIEAYAAAGYRKLHLDCSMGCAGEPAALPDTETAQRAARLAARAEAARPGAALYIIGTEVPTPGGATEGLDHLAVTRPDAVRATYRVHEAAFAAQAPSAWARVIAMVVQPGVEFGHADVAIYRRSEARSLSATLADLPGLVFEAHSTDYQPEECLRALVEDGFPILKVGPGLTFALRETFYGLDAIAAALQPSAERLPDVMEQVMLADPAHWLSHYPGSPDAQQVLRHFSYSDRIRYYWPAAQARAAVHALLAQLGPAPLPETLISQFLPRLYDRVLRRQIEARADTLLIQSVRDVLRVYARACAPGG
jgi:D-tagatose 6-phosphate 4-epimerase